MDDRQLNILIFLALIIHIECLTLIGLVLYIKDVIQLNVFLGSITVYSLACIWCWWCWHMYEIKDRDT